MFDATHLQAIEFARKKISSDNKTVNEFLIDIDKLLHERKDEGFYKALGRATRLSAQEQKTLSPLLHTIAYQLALSELGPGQYTDFAVQRAFKILFQGAQDLRILPGHLTHKQFLEGDYQIFGTSANKIIIPWPHVDKIVPAADNRFYKGGFTGDPHTSGNATLARKAFESIDRSTVDPMKEFWAILYPELTHVYDGGDNSSWPAYGQAIIDLHNNRLINYARIYAVAQTPAGVEKLQKELSPEILNKIEKFYPDHKHFWLIARQDQKALLDDTNKSDDEKRIISELNAWKNYYDFFVCLNERILKSYQIGFGESTHDNIGLQGVELFRRLFAPTLLNFYHYIETLNEKARKRFENETKAQVPVYGESGILNIAYTLLNPPSNLQTASCFAQNFIKLSTFYKEKLGAS